MKKTTLILAFLTFSSFGFHNFVITPDSARIGIDTVTLTGLYEHVGDTLTITNFFMDVNHNGVWDPGTDIDELGGSPFQIIDGAKPSGGKNGPSDTVADGALDLKIETTNSPFNTPGYFIFILTSGGKADTAGYKLLLTKTSTFITGTVTDPGANPVKNIQIQAEIRDASTGNTITHVNMVTDSLGVYVSYFDSTYRGKRLRLSINTNPGGAIQSTWLYPQQIDTLLVDSLKGLNFAFTSASHFVKGVVQDENGAVVKRAPCYMQDSINSQINFTTDSLGKFLVGVKTGRYSMYLQWWNFSGYLVSNRNNQLTMTSATDTVHFTWVLHTADTVISGTVTDDSATLSRGNLPIIVTGNVQDTSYQTGVDLGAGGVYKVHVTSYIDTYNVSAITNNLPGKFYVYPPAYPAVHYGNTACNFSILKGAAMIGGNVQDTLGNGVRDCQIMIADTAQKLYFQVQENNNGFNQPVPSGTWMISFSGFSQPIGMDVSGTAGPITITSSSKDTMIICVARVKATGLWRNGNGFGLAPFSFSTPHSPASVPLKTFAFSTPVAGRARLALFDLEGRTVAVILNRNVTAGSYRVNWDPDAQFGLVAANKTYIAKFDFLGARTYGAAKKFTLVR